MQRSRLVMVVGGLLALVVLVVSVGTRDPGSPVTSTSAIESTAPAAPESTTAATLAPRSDRTVPESFPHSFVLPAVVDGVAVLEIAGGTFTFEVIGHGEDTVQVLPDSLGSDGRYYRLRYDRPGNAISAQASGDGVVWEPLAPIPEEVENPNLIQSPSGPVLMSYGFDEDQTPGELWRFWRWRDGQWLPLVGIPADAGFASGPILRVASGDEILVTVGEGPFRGLMGAGMACPGAQGASQTEFGLSVNLVDMCGGVMVRTLSLVGSGDGAVAVLSDDEGVVLWRSAPGVERYFDQLLSFALAAGPDSPSNADHIILAGGQQRFWASTDGLQFELAETLDVSPWAIQPTVLNGEMIVLQPEITLTPAAGGERIGEQSRVRVLTSPDARTWTDAGLDLALPIGMRMGQITVTAAGRSVLVTVLDRGFVGVPGQWEELEGMEPWDWFQPLGDQWLAYDYGRELALGISSDGATWDSFAPNLLIGALDCGADFTDWRVVGDELWFSTWDGRGVCIIRGRFTPTS